VLSDDEAGGDKAGKASRRLPIPGRESPASDRVYPLERNPTPPIVTSRARPTRPAA